MREDALKGLRIARPARQIQQRSGGVESSWVQHRQDRTQHRFLAAVKALAQVRKLLQPSPRVQVNIAQQQVNVG
jgi:hypothetical protein